MLESIIHCSDKKAAGNVPMSDKIQSMRGKGVNDVCSWRPSILTVLSLRTGSINVSTKTTEFFLLNWSNMITDYDANGARNYLSLA
jgi:hypothetical protein